MARRAVTQDLYDLLLQGFREAPGNASHAAKVAGCDRRMAKRGWEEGWPAASWARPIRERIHEERQAARAQAATLEREAQEAQASERAKAAREAAEVLAQEGQLMKVGRNDVLGVLVIAAQMLPAMRALAERLKDQLLNPALDPVTGQPAPLNPKEVLAIFRGYAAIAGRGVDAATKLIELERLRRGDPSEILRIDVEPASLEDATAELAAASDALARAKELGLSVLDGGRAGKASA